MWKQLLHLSPIPKFLLETVKCVISLLVFLNRKKKEQQQKTTINQKCYPVVQKKILIINSRLLEVYARV